MFEPDPPEGVLEGWLGKMVWWWEPRPLEECVLVELELLGSPEAEECCGPGVESISGSANGKLVKLKSAHAPMS